MEVLTSCHKLIEIGPLRFSVLFVQGTPVLEIRKERNEIMTPLSAKSGLSERGIAEGPLASATRQDFHKQTITITATFTAESVEEVLAYWMQELALNSTSP